MASKVAVMSSSLFKPLKLGNITIPNRIGMSALTRNRAPGTVPNDVMEKYYVQRAASGLIVSEGALVTRQGTEWPHAPGIWNKEHATAWKKITDAVHAAGGHIYCQLWHVGRVSHPEAPEQIAAGVPVYAPSAISAKGGKFRHLGGIGYVTPTAVPDPWVLVAQFKEAAIQAKAAGFDGVELHGANGYLIAQFLDTSSNQRTDQWGGSIENRARFGLEVLKAIKEVFGKDVALKVNPGGGYNDMGMPLQESLDTYSYFISEADKLDLSYIVLVRYLESMDPKYDGVLRGTPHDILASYGPLVKNAKIFLNGGVSAEEGAELIAAGKIDGFFIGFMYIAHPDLVKRVQHGKPLDNMPDFPHMQWGKGEKDLEIGYTDYPEATY